MNIQIINSRNSEINHREKKISSSAVVVKNNKDEQGIVWQYMWIKI